MEILSSLANANPAHRIQRPNSIPRSIAIFGLGVEGTRLAENAVASGVAVTPLSLAAIARDTRPAELSKLNSVVIVGRPDEETGGTAARIYQWAGKIGVLVTAVVVSRDQTGLAIGANVHTMRTNADLITMTTDEDYLPTMLQWIGRTG
ncbi:hypothetical protein [Pelagibacterium luteolum]|uniref:Uncharacterized protein n=1 Tax=Pelagibacterium luteolum TaxID=440168 RepID=A0A1G7SWZ8_9HYPH|nr:hypothetical protein [Pelagibacterium luteolum]SDG27392.1 hypothetical protein SAMN04487974_101772 [Pelagibacterium luteolum]